MNALIVGGGVAGTVSAMALQQVGIEATIFESHPPEIEGAHFGNIVKLIEQRFEIERNEVHDYGTFLDKNRRFIVATRR